MALSPFIAVCDTRVGPKSAKTSGRAILWLMQRATTSLRDRAAAHVGEERQISGFRKLEERVAPVRSSAVNDKDGPQIRAQIEGRSLVSSQCSSLDRTAKSRHEPVWSAAIVNGTDRAGGLPERLPHGRSVIIYQSCGQAVSTYSRGAPESGSARSAPRSATVFNFMPRSGRLWTPNG